MDTKRPREPMVLGSALLIAALAAGVSWLTGWGNPMDAALAWGVGAFVVGWFADMKDRLRRIEDDVRLLRSRD